VRTAEAALRRGHRALKLKVGFGTATDLANLAGLRAIAGAGMLAADANQGWTVEQALEILPRLREFDLSWLEEPIRADRPRTECRRCVQARARRLPRAKTLQAGSTSNKYFRRTCLVWVSRIFQSGVGLPFVPDWRATSSRQARRFVHTISAAALAC